ncbi:MAG: hypothetical protein Q9218_000635 [Villophora microphyllina]
MGRQHQMSIEAPRPPPSSQISDVITAGKSVPASHDAGMSKAFNEEAALNDRAKIIISVGTGTSQQVFHVERATLCLSLYFARSVSYSLASSQVVDVDLPDEDPAVVEMFVEWVKRPKQPIIYAPGQYSDEPWISNAAAAWLLGHCLDAAMFQEYALSQLIQNCALALRGPWRSIEEKAPARSPLRRFSNHWVAWDTSLSGPDLNEYTGLNAAKFADQVRPSTRDPRILDLNHWYTNCGDDINANCAHDPIFRASQREKERLRKRTPPPVWGAEYERANTSTISNPVRTNCKIPKSPPPLGNFHGRATRTSKPIKDWSRSDESLKSPSLYTSPRRKANAPLGSVEEWLRSNEVPNSPSSSRVRSRRATPTLSPVEDWLRSNEV